MRVPRKGLRVLTTVWRCPCSSCPCSPSPGRCPCISVRTGRTCPAPGVRTTAAPAASLREPAPGPRDCSSCTQTKSNCNNSVIRSRHGSWSKSFFSPPGLSVNPPVEGERVVELDHGLRRQITSRQHLQSLHQLHHGVVVLSAAHGGRISYFTFHIIGRACFQWRGMYVPVCPGKKTAGSSRCPG